MFKHQRMYLGLLSTLVISYFVFYFTFYYQVWWLTETRVVSDVPFHTEFILKFAKEGTFPAYSLWYRLVYLLSGFSNSYLMLAKISIVLLSLLISTKYLITYHILNKKSDDNRIIAMMSFALIFVMPVISYYPCWSTSTICFFDLHIYLGNVAPNQWHNSTLILAMPFNLLLFYYAISHINSKNMLPFLKMGLLGIVSLLCKPNYGLAFIPVLCIAIILINIKEKKYWIAFIKSSLIIFPVLLTLIYQWYSTYINNDILPSGSKTIVSPFFVWEHYSPHILVSLLLSIAFPLFIALAYFKRLSTCLKYSWMTFILSMFIMIVFAEFPNWGAWNFLWGAISANYILFLFSVEFLITQPLDWKSSIAYSIFKIHFVSGFILLFIFFIAHKTLML